MVNPKLQTLAHIKNYKDQWRLEDSLQHPQNREFVQHPLCSSCARSKRATTCWTTSLRSRCLWINSLLLGGIYKRRRHYFSRPCSRMLALNKYLIIALETMPMKELMMEYMITYLIHEMVKCKEQEPQGEDAAMVLRQSKARVGHSRKFIKPCEKVCRVFFVRL